MKNRQTPLIVALLLIASLACSMLAGCVHRVSHLTAETETTSPVVTVQGTGTNTSRTTNFVIIVERRTLREGVTVVMDGKNTVDRFKASNSAKTQTVGITGENQEASGSNTVEALKSIDSILSKVRPTP